MCMFEQKMDINHDGVISLEEFMETCIKVTVCPPSGAKRDYRLQKNSWK